jgi:hypothetical protein
MHTGKALGISHGIEETDQFNHVAFMHDITVVAQDNLGLQILMDAVQEFDLEQHKIEYGQNSGNEYRWRERGKESTSSDVQATTNHGFSSH